MTGGPPTKEDFDIRLPGLDGVDHSLCQGFLMIMNVMSVVASPGTKATGRIVQIRSPRVMTIWGMLTLEILKNPNMRF